MESNDGGTKPTLGDPPIPTPSPPVVDPFLRLTHRFATLRRHHDQMLSYYTASQQSIAKKRENPTSDESNIETEPTKLQKLDHEPAQHHEPSVSPATSTMAKLVSTSPSTCEDFKNTNIQPIQSVYAQLSDTSSPDRLTSASTSSCGPANSPGIKQIEQLDPVYEYDGQ